MIGYLYIAMGMIVILGVAGAVLGYVGMATSQPPMSLLRHLEQFVMGLLVVAIMLGTAIVFLGP